MPAATTHPQPELTRGPLATTDEVAAILHKSVAALNQMRGRGEGPPYLKIGRRVYYRLGDVDAYLESLRTIPPERTRDSR
ncbi:helix-turn-helix domain-containing protein [Agromyces endophyticus]|uniref:helix-turn-helix domain-containing protein n=1 Tax=Agromyces sp. H17E-10 TaxID=2932244 RepID=UPI001FD00F56|nr:helix-turn-helix domain-containing protein [Agromyces sp. H17E-10]UOQ90687.1 helix-turn-helix domain-containing protein [Agromyces sp. H17E-10]